MPAPRQEVIVNVPDLLADQVDDAWFRARLAAAIERVVGSSESLSLDNEGDREVLISRLKRALGLSA